MKRRALLAAAAGSAASTFAHGAAGLTTSTLAPTEPEASLHVGPARRIETLAEAAAVAREGDVIDVDAGDYAGDVAVWTRNRITLRSRGGRVRLRAAGAAAEAKAIWVVRAEALQVRGFDFEGARVAHRNGAGIRLEAGSAHVVDCRFLHNENGILTGNDPATQLSVDDSEFGFNGHGDGQSHNLYAGRIARLAVSGCHFHHALRGHLLKTRAAQSEILYSLLRDGAEGHASYELEFPNGGEALVMGCVVEQGPLTDNPKLISFGAEGLGADAPSVEGSGTQGQGPAARHRLALIHNTLVDGLPRGGTMLWVAPGPVELLATDNLLVGAGRLEDAGPGRFERNFTLGASAFAAAARGDYRLRPGAGIIGAAGVRAHGRDPLPSREYDPPHRTRLLDSPPVRPGAFQSLARDG